MSGPYYRLSEGYALRGWEQTPFALVEEGSKRVKSLKLEEFRLLVLCDGRTELSPDMLSQKERETLRSFIERGAISASDAPSPIAAEQEYSRYHNRMLKSAHWSITGRCNFHCRHCFMDAPDAAMGEISHQEALAIIEQLAECGIYRVDLTGGEPFVRADFWELVDAILAHGLVVGTVYTNGWLVDEKLLDQFERRGLRPEFSVSFDGVGWHDWMRGVEGAEEAAIRALRLCIARGFPVDVEMCVHKGNAHLIRESVNLLADIGVYAIKCNAVNDSELWKMHNEGNDYGFRDFCEDAIAYIPRFFEDGCPANVLMGSVVNLRRGSMEYSLPAERYEEGKALKCHLCGSVRLNGYISPEGRLLPCMPMSSAAQEVQMRFPKIVETGLQKCLSDSFYMQFIDSRVGDLIKVNEKCRECPHVLKCGGGCRAAALEQSGDLMGADEKLCILWNEGYVERIRRTAEDAVRRFPPKESGHEAAEN